MTWIFDHLTPRRYRVILADPPWRFITFNDVDQSKKPEQHYRTMTLETIAAMPVRELGHPEGSVLAMWTTGPMLAAGHAHTIMRAWGYPPTAAGAWAKLSKTGRRLAMGTGHILRGAGEFFLIGRRGGIRKNLGPAAKSVRNMLGADLVEAKGLTIVEPVREHSRKPEDLHQALEILYPGPHLELFARSARRGWSAWGNEVGKFR